MFPLWYTYRMWFHRQQTLSEYLWWAEKRRLPWWKFYSYARKTMRGWRIQFTDERELTYNGVIITGGKLIDVDVGHSLDGGRIVSIKIFDANLKLKKNARFVTR